MDATVTWKGAVPFDAVRGQSARTSGNTTVDSRAIAAGFDIRPFHSESVESAMKGAMPYVSALDDADDEEK